MKIKVSAKTNQKKEGIISVGSGYTVFSKKSATENKANLDIIRQLAEYFGVSKSRIILISGQKSKTKNFEITG